MNTSNIVKAAVVPEDARILLRKGMAEACKAEGYRQKADKHTAASSTLLTEAAIACGSAEAWEMLTESYYIEIRNNVGGAATAINAVKGKGGEYLIPPVARTVISELTKAFKLGTSLFEPELDKDGNETDTPSEKPRSFRKVRAANKVAKDAAEDSRLKAGNAPLWEMVKLTESVSLSVTQFRTSAAWMVANAEAAEAQALLAAAARFIEAAQVVATLAQAEAAEAAEAEKAEAAEADKAGDVIAEAEATTEAEAKPTPRRGRRAANK